MQSILINILNLISKYYLNLIFFFANKLDSNNIKVISTIKKYKKII